MDESVWLKGARRCPSPNFNQRPQGANVSLLVIHNISLPPGEYGTGDIEAFFCNQLDWDKHPFYQEIKGVEVSSHLLITRTGEVVQFVPLNERAWHAGKSVFKGVENCNDFSIGIELEGTDTDPYSDAQYRVLAEVSRELMRQYPALCADNIAGHDAIAPGRKTDPGPAFDWARYRKSLEENAG
ncbi:MAG: 1,6-anhydro-N-acetylmuramyl-L-alanine amidase AmpD [Oceanospirillaceae bacterium]|nr:1,6-anhydro-N-acetylmuramyl-L-alanine amidase AmpD [Oceanospirillaceae bacterium]MCP5351118.1 1,6-anhydro-N-acetylmuramyl-L-alanine amidase AmpD [Oceanospirillaceae bacterium]